jgi:uncharacterized protein GlcG (DUF336 family)
MAYQPDLSHAEARAIVDRAVSKARELKLPGNFVVVDAGGGLVTLSRAGECAASSVWVARAKAYVSAMQRAPSARAATMWRERPAIFSAYQHLMQDEIFPGPGAMPIRKNGRVVGAISTGGGGVGPWTEIPGVDPKALTVDGEPANAEDLVIAYALQIKYENQHTDVTRLVGNAVEERNDGLPHSLDTARKYADRAIAAAKERGYNVSVAVVDEVGQLMQVDRMDGSPAMAADLAEAKAMTSLNYGRPTADVGKTVSADRLREIAGIIRFKFLAGAGGVPILQDGQVVGAVGVHGGGGGEASDAVARAAVGE